MSACRSCCVHFFGYYGLNDSNEIRSLTPSLWRIYLYNCSDHCRRLELDRNLGGKVLINLQINEKRSEARSSWKCWEGPSRISVMFPVTRTGVTQQQHDFQVRTMGAAEPWIFNPTKVWWLLGRITGVLLVTGHSSVFVCRSLKKAQDFFCNLNCKVVLSLLTGCYVSFWYTMQEIAQSFLSISSK